MPRLQVLTPAQRAGAALRQAPSPARSSGSQRLMSRRALDGGGAKAAVVVPDVAPREGRRSAAILDDRARGLGRAVVGDQQFEIRRALRAVAGQHRAERVGPVVGGDDDGRFHGARFGFDNSISLT